MVKLHYYKAPLNLGDQLAPIIVDWILKNRNIKDTSTKDINLLTVGSILAADFFDKDAVIWGTGVHYVEDAGRLACYVQNRKLDIRAVRGPITRRALEQAGYPCPHIYGDPAILMPYIYPKENVKQKGKISVIRQLDDTSLEVPRQVDKINIGTKDYKNFIDRIVSSERIISSSLHGIILGESYHVPSIFLLEHETQEILKYFDWYYATGRTGIKIAHSIEEAIYMEPMELPEIDRMQKKLLESFPMDAYQPDYWYETKKEIVLFGLGECFFRRINKIKEKVRVRYVCDNDSSKWGKCVEGLTCISPKQLYEMKNIYVVITIDIQKYVEAVERQLDQGGIKFHETVFQWLRHMNYGAFASRE